MIYSCVIVSFCKILLLFLFSENFRINSDRMIQTSLSLSLLYFENSIICVLITLLLLLFILPFKISIIVIRVYFLMKISNVIVFLHFLSDILFFHIIYPLTSKLSSNLTFVYRSIIHKAFKCKVNFI